MAADVVADDEIRAISANDTPPEIDLIEFDDKEFDIPSIEVTPTLESILNEPDTDSVLDDEDLQTSIDWIHTDSLDTSSSSSHDSQHHGSPDKRHHKEKGQNVHGSVLRRSKLKNISAQILSAADRVNAGMPTAMAVAELIAIGTSHGLVLVFDAKQVLKWCLGSTAVGSQYGAVSALSFNIDCTRLLSGFAKGQITMWDLTNGKLLRTITDAHPLGSAVLHVKFTDSLTLALCSDSGGSVFELEFKRLIGVRSTDSRCLFSGSRGEVCVIEPLHMNYNIKDHPMQDVVLLVMASLSKVLVLTVKPQLKVMFTHSLKGSSATLPLLAWQFVIIQVSDVDRVIDPVLALARDSSVYFYQVICNNEHDIKCQGLQKMVLPYTLLSIKWMNGRTLATLDTSEKIHIIDVRTEEELEVIDISDVQLVYGSSHFKSLATGGNVSQALAYAGEQSCYQSLESYTGQLFVLGTKSIHVLTLRTWRERIDVLVKQNKYREALALALSIYEGKAKAVIGLTGAAHKKKDIVADLMLDLLFEFVDLSMTQFCPTKGKMEELEEYYQDVVPVCVDYCLHLGRIDILFGRIYERFGMDVIAKLTFLECLEPYILNDKLTTIIPTVMKDFIESYESRDMLESIEACIVHLDVASLDIHQIVNLCWKHDLYDAIIYVYNKGMQDYTTPLEELLGKLKTAVQSGIQLTYSEIRLGNKLLVYVSCCLAGRAYPLGDIPDDIVTRVKLNVFSCVTSLHTKDPTDDERIYPHLRTLLQYDTAEFLNVLALAFEEDEFNTEEGCIKRQRLVDILLEVMVEGSAFTPGQVGMLFTFLARQMSRHENTIFVKRTLFEQVLEFLCNSENESRHEERQQALLDLLKAGGLQQFDENRLLHLAEDAKFYYVCELLHEKRREYDKILSCYLKDTSRKHLVFDFINAIMKSDRYNDMEKSSVRRQAMLSLQDLVTIDCEKSAHLVIDGFSENLLQIVNDLKQQPQLLLNFLHGVLLYWEASGSAIHPERQVTVEAEVFEEYIDLLCRFKPLDVCTYVKTNDGYRLEQTLQIVRRYKITDATAFLLEKAGDVQGAFRIMLENLQSKLRSLQECLLAANISPMSKESEMCMSCVQTVLMVIVQICQRNSSRLDEAGREALWFPLLEVMLSPQRKLKDVVAKNFMIDYKELTHHVLNSMMGYIALPAILQKIMQDPAYNAGKFGEVKDLILGMLETYNYEETLMTTCKNLMYHDLHTHLSTLTHTAVRGYVPRSSYCEVCSRQFIASSGDTDTIIVFRCGHGYHTTCLQSMGSVHVIDSEEIWSCYMCSNSKQSQRLSNTRLQQSSKRNMKKNVRQSPSPTKEPSIDSQESEYLENLRSCMKSKSRLQILTELSRPTTSRPLHDSTSILQNEKFQLRLASLLFTGPHT